MKFTHRLIVGTSVIALSATIGFTVLAQGPPQGQPPAGAPGQGPGRGQGGPGAGGPGRGAPAANLPTAPTAVTLPTVTGPITGPGNPYESVQSLAPGKGLANFKYEAKEYFIAGTA